MVSPGSGNVSSWISQGIEKAGVGADWTPYLNWIIQKESSGNPQAKNSKSSAYGLMQFLDSTWKNYGIGNRDNPVDQVVSGINYIKKRYGTPQNAVAFWQQNGWY